MLMVDVQSYTCMKVGFLIIHLTNYCAITTSMLLHVHVLHRVMSVAEVVIMYTGTYFPC